MNAFSQDVVTSKSKPIPALNRNTCNHGFVPNVGDSYQILTSSSRTGVFTENLPVLPADREWDTEYSSSSVTLKVLALLPVELSRFDADVIKDKVVLKWRTESEIDNRGFEIQRSYDGSSWRSLDFVSGGGTTHQVRNYQYDDYPNPGHVYYRLRQVDWNGKFELSVVKTVVVNADGSYRFVEVHPNPVEEKEINVFFPNGIEDVAFYHITDATGRVSYRGACEPGEGVLKRS